MTDPTTVPDGIPAASDGGPDDAQHATVSADPGATGDTSIGDRDTGAGPDSAAGHRRAKPSAGARVLAGVREIVVVIVMALALSFVVKTWLAQAFYIPSESMQDTLVVDDRVIVNKLTPGLMDLHRGDVVVFSDPDHWLGDLSTTQSNNSLTKALIFIGLMPNPSEDHLIKRVIGLPGDHVVCCDAAGKLQINGTSITEPYLKPGVTPSDRAFDIIVPKDRIWVMGDNRSNSEDSRYHDPSGTGAQGSVPIDDVTGRAIARVWPLGRMGWLSDFGEVFATVPEGTSTPRPASAPTTSASIDS